MTLERRSFHRRGTWSAPEFVPLPGSTSPIGSQYAVIALPSDGSTVLGLTIGSHIFFATAPQGGMFGSPVALGRFEAFGLDLPSPTKPQIVSFGADAALAWLSPHGHGLTLKVAVKPPLGRPVQQTLGPPDQLTASRWPLVAAWRRSPG